MKIESWKPPVGNESSSETPGLYVDDSVIFRSSEKDGTEKMALVAALLVAVDHVATRRPFSIDDQAFKTWLSFDGTEVTGPESLRRAVADLAVVADVMCQHYFIKRVEEATEVARELASKSISEQTTARNEGDVSIELPLEAQPASSNREAGVSGEDTAEAPRAAPVEAPVEAPLPASPAPLEVAVAPAAVQDDFPHGL